MILILLIFFFFFFIKADSPAHLIQKILIGGQDDNDDKFDLENHSIFSELSVLHINNGNYVWKETARFENITLSLNLFDSFSKSYLVLK